MQQEIKNSASYIHTLTHIKQKVKTAQIKAHLSVNKEMLILYWQIGNVILEQRKANKWGSRIIEQLAKDLKSEFNTMKGFSATNLKYMASFADSYPNLLVIKDKQAIGHQTGDQLEHHYFINDSCVCFLNIPWRHNVEIYSQVKNMHQRLWYAKQTIEHGWSRNILVMQIESNLYSRQANSENKINNFQLTLPSNNSDLANDIFKDEYNFEFIDNTKGRLAERVLEKALTDDVVKFLIELGKGFAFVGKQYHLEVGEDDYYIDLLFYHLELRSYIVIELKTTKFKPEYAGKMAFYLSQIDKNLRKDSDNNSIGIILCSKSASQEVQETVNYITKPVGVATYQVSENKDLPEELKPLEDLKKLI